MSLYMYWTPEVARFVCGVPGCGLVFRYEISVLFQKVLNAIATTEHMWLAYLLISAWPTMSTNYHPYLLKLFTQQFLEKEGKK